MKTTKSGFTLIELLVVIAIIAILAAILFPVFARAREKARQATCTSNQRQIAASIQMYSQDHEEQFPNTTSVWKDINVDPGVLLCPTKGKTQLNGYLYNCDIGDYYGYSQGNIKDPTTVWFTVDGTVDTNGLNLASNISQFDSRHSGKVVASFADGHVNSVLSSTLSLEGPTPSFIPPSGLGVWLLADFPGPGAVAGPLATWRDKSGNKLSAAATGTAIPTLVTSGGPNSKPYVSFNGTTQALSGTPPSFTGMDAFIIGRINTGAAANCGVVCMSDKTNHDYVTGVQNAIIWSDGWNAGNASGGDSRWLGNYNGISNLTLPLNVWYCYGFTQSGGNSVIRSKGAQIASGGSNGADSNTPLIYTVGSRVLSGIPGGFCKTDVAEVMLFKNALSTTDRQRVEQYLISKYNL